MRAVVPVYNRSGCQGFLGRTIQPSCQICNLYHFPNRLCPQNSIERKWAAKWIVEKNFKKENYLYNLDKALPYIEKCRRVVIVESPGNVWRCWENGVRNCIALMGTSLTTNQQFLLESILIKWVIIALDPDKAGIEGTEKIVKQLTRTYLIKCPNINYGKYNDIGDMDNNYFKKNVYKELI